MNPRSRKTFSARLTLEREHLCIGDCQGLYIERPGDNSLIWGDTSVGGGFALASDNLDKTAIKKIAEKISAK